MDFTLENWEQLGPDQGDLFWDTALDNYQSLFLLNPCRPNLTVCPDEGELEALVRGSPESAVPDMAEAKNSPLPQDFLEEGPSQEILETLSKDGQRLPVGEACISKTTMLKGKTVLYLTNQLVRLGSAITALGKGTSLQALLSNSDAQRNCVLCSYNLMENVLALKEGKKTG
ncbi:hypothetical protein MUG91_G177n3 [Manis pentadactyla]|nr:hypothetical protein MUG91_G177n3 [Manis pentadactyla]